MKKNYFNPDQLKQAKQQLKPTQSKIKKSIQNMLSSQKGKQKADPNEPNSIMRISEQVRNQSLIQNKAQEQIKKKPTPEQLIIKIQNRFRVKKCRKAYLEMVKQYRYRRSVIKELVATEEKYCEDLRIITEVIMKQCSSLITQQQLSTLFCNVTSIKKLNDSFLAELSKHFGSTIPPYSLLGSIMLEFAPFFKIYFQYYNDFKVSEQTLEQLRKSNKKFNELIGTFIKSKAYNFQDLESYLIKPIQRLPKYVLLLKDLLKHTPKDHPDYQMLEKALESYSTITEENNEKLNKVLKNAKIFELQRMYPNYKIVDSKREFLMEKLMTLFWKNKEKAVLTYFFSDLLLVTERGVDSKSVISALQLSAGSQVRSVEDSQYFRHLYTVVGENDTLTFIAENDQVKLKRMNQVEDIIHSLEQLTEQRNLAFSRNALLPLKQNYKIAVQILGTEQRQKNAFKSYTVYIIEISIQEISQNVYLRFSECLDIQEHVKKNHPKVIIPYIKEGSWTNKNTSKEIETRSLQISNFLQSILSQIRDYAILKMIGLPANFYTLPELLDEQPVRSNSRKFSMKTLESIRGSVSGSFISTSVQRKRKLSAQKLLRSSGSQDKLLERLHSYAADKQSKDNNLEVVIHTLKKAKQEIEVKVQGNTKVIDLLDHVEGLIDDNFDFKFLLMDKGKIVRVLDDDELLFQVFYGKSIKEKVKKEKKDIYYRKYIYLDYKMEEVQYQEDLVKLDMVFRQFVDEIQHNQYQLQFKEYCFFCALYFFIYQVPLDKQQYKFDYDKLGDLIPSAILKATKKEVWSQYIPEMHQNLKESVKAQGSFSVEDLAKMIFINTMYQNQLCGIQLYAVKAPKETLATLKFNEESLFLGVGYQGVSIFNQKKKTLVKKIDFINFSTVKTYPGAITVTDLFGKTYKFETMQGVQIQILINEYQELMEDLEQVII